MKLTKSTQIMTWTDISKLVVVGVFVLTDSLVMHEFVLLPMYLHDKLLEASPVLSTSVGNHYVCAVLCLVVMSGLD